MSIRISKNHSPMSTFWTRTFSPFFENKFCRLFTFLIGKCHGLTPAGSWAPHSYSFIPLWWNGERIGGAKVRKLMGWVKKIWKGKAKPMHTKEAKQGIRSLLPIGRQVFSHLQESRAPWRIAVTLEDKHCISKHRLLPSSSFQIYMLSITLYGFEYSFGQFEPDVMTVSPPSFLCNLRFLVGRPVWEAEK